jgi:hypothetical protein
MSSENTPILAATIPAFELFLSAWEAMKADEDLVEENVASIITPGLNLAKSYYKKLEDSNAYIIAMCEWCSAFHAQSANSSIQSSTPLFGWNGSRRTGLLVIRLQPG